MLFAIDPSGLTFSNLPYSSYVILEEYLERDDISSKCHVLRAMTGICFSNPRMLFRSKSFYAVKNAELRAARPRADAGERK